VEENEWMEMFQRILHQNKLNNKVLTMEEIKEVMAALHSEGILCLEFYQNYARVRQQAKEQLNSLCQTLAPSQEMSQQEAAARVMVLSIMSDDLKKIIATLMEKEILAFEPIKNQKN